MIDWDDQWKAHAPGYKNGLVHIQRPVSFVMRPGPGFGDCSHPTTNLMLDLMPHYVKGRDVIDIGCGSGVLSIAAYLLGARSVKGIDICPEAVDHAKGNAALNGASIDFSTEPLQRIENAVILINMISSEQRGVWQGIEVFDDSLCIISGLLEGEDLLNSIIEEKRSHGWKACVTSCREACRPFRPCPA